MPRLPFEPLPALSSVRAILTMFGFPTTRTSTSPSNTKSSSSKSFQSKATEEGEEKPAEILLLSPEEARERGEGRFRRALSELPPSLTERERSCANEVGRRFRGENARDGVCAPLSPSRHPDDPGGRASEESGAAGLFEVYLRGGGFEGDASIFFFEGFGRIEAESSPEKQIGKNWERTDKMHAWKLACLVTALLSPKIEGFLFLFPFRPFPENPSSPPPAEPPETYVSMDCSTKLSEMSTNVYVTEDLDYGVCPGDTEAILVGGMPALDLGSLSTGEIYEYYELEYGNTKCTSEGNCCVLEVLLEPYIGDTNAIVGAQEMSMLFRGPECRNFALSGTVLTSTSGMVKMFNYSTSDTEYRLRDLGLLACETEGVIGSVQRATFCTHP